MGAVLCYAAGIQQRNKHAPPELVGYHILEISRSASALLRACQPPSTLLSLAQSKPTYNDSVNNISTFIFKF